MSKQNGHVNEFTYAAYWNRMAALGQSTVQLLQSQAEVSTFLRANHLSLKEWLTDKLGLFRLGYSADRLPKLKEMNLSPQHRQLTYLISMLKFYLSSEN